LALGRSSVTWWRGVPPSVFRRGSPLPRWCEIFPFKPRRSASLSGRNEALVAAGRGLMLASLVRLLRPLARVNHADVVGASEQHLVPASKNCQFYVVPYLHERLHLRAVELHHEVRNAVVVVVTDAGWPRFSRENCFEQVLTLQHHGIDDDVFRAVSNR